MKILVYDDSLDFGGHQIMACRGIEALSRDPLLQVTVCFNPGNLKLARRISAIPDLSLLECSDACRPFQGVRNRFNPRRIRELEEKFHEVQPDAVLCVQGDIEQSSMAVMAAERAGIDCISYIALPHRLSDMGVPFGGLRDRLNHYLLNLPGRYITVSESMKERLVNRGVKKPIRVVTNGIPIPASANREPQTADTALGLLGRIEFKQKAQDFMVDTFCRQREAFHGCRLIIAGSGPDEEKLRRLAAKSSCRDRITFLPWQEDPEQFYGQIDFLLLPSRFEGMPLVMLEALSRGIPVIGSACDGMKDLLPVSWTFLPGDGSDLARTFRSIRTTRSDEIDEISKRVKTEMNAEAFKTAFYQAVMQEP